ncbi:MAG: DUF1571 domain-containing protein [Pirellulaceae bacterium]
MSRRILSRSAVGILLLGVLPAILAQFAGGDEKRSRQGLTEPVFRVSSRIDAVTAVRPEHPLDPALQIAAETLDYFRKNVHDYSCTLVKQERINGELWEPEYIYTEIRNRKFEGNRTTVPLSVYMYFLKPSKFKGREVMFVEGRNKNKLLAYEGCSAVLRKLGAVALKPDNALAMKGNRYPITEAGMENLMVKLMEKGQRDRKRGECDVQFMKGAKINGRTCTVLQVTHPTPRPYFDFHIARIFIDDELSIPIRYAAYMWPSKPGGKPQLLESYTYLNVKLNVGLSEDDFDHKKKFRM